MAETFKFPGGNDVRIVRKQDVVACIERNITDGDLLLDLIKQLEIDAIDYVNAGRWTGIPYLGNIRIPKRRQILDTPQYKELIESARDTLDRDKYVLFRRRLDADIQKKVKQDRYYNYVLSQAINRNIRVFKRVSKAKGDTYAKLYVYFLFIIKPATYKVNLFQHD